MGNSQHKFVDTSKNTLSSLSDDELLFKLHQEIYDEKISLEVLTLELTHIELSSKVAREYSRRFKKDGYVDLGKLKRVLNSYKRPYTLSLGKDDSISIQFVIFPTSESKPVDF
jgi:hypothetical protein